MIFTCFRIKAVGMIRSTDPHWIRLATNLECQRRARVERLRDMLEKLESFDADSIQAGFKEVAAELEVKMGVLVHPIRLACTGKKVGPSLFHLMEVLGKEKVMARTEAIMPRLSDA